MNISIKRTLITSCMLGLLVLSTSYGNSESFLSKTYQLIYDNRTITTTSLIYNGEIFINLSDITTTTGLATNLTSETITLSNKSSTSSSTIDSDGNLYSGELLNNVPHGKGTSYLKEGGKYEGQWINGLYEGQGTLVLANDNIYVGTFSKGFIHGEGKMFYPDGSYYKGHYEYGIREGFGLLYIDKNNKYEGYWSNGLRNGKGKAYINGLYRKGLWENNQMIKTLSDSSFDF